MRLLSTIAIRYLQNNRKGSNSQSILHYYVLLIGLKSLCMCSFRFNPHTITHTMNGFTSRVDGAL